eukprot:9633450-Alexandrium_andersonii.AAC.1
MCACVRACARKGKRAHTCIAALVAVTLPFHCVIGEPLLGIVRGSEAAGELRTSGLARDPQSTCRCRLRRACGGASG